MATEFDAIEHPNVFSWFKDLAKNDALAFATLCGGNYDAFKALWGSPNGKTQRFDYWKKDYSGITVFIYTEKTTTFYKVQYLGERDIFLQDRKIGAYLNAFLSKLTKDLLQQ